MLALDQDDLHQETDDLMSYGIQGIRLIKRIVHQLAPLPYHPLQAGHHQERMLPYKVLHQPCFVIYSLPLGFVLPTQ